MGGDAPLATIKIGSDQVAEINQADAIAAFDEIAGSERFVQAVYSGAMTTADQQAVVTQLIRGEVLKAEADKLGATPTPEAFDAARQQLEEELVQVAASVDPGDPDVAAAEIRGELGSYFDRIADRVANETALREVFANEIEGGLPCASHILVSLDDEALANDLFDQLQSGADFAQLAAEFSIDGSRESGGDIGCTDPQRFVAAFRDAVISAEVDELVGPVETEFGFHIIKVTGYEDPAAIEARINAIYDDVTVSVDPGFGVWNTTITPQAIVDAPSQ